MPIVFGLARYRRTFINPLWTPARAIRIFVSSRQSSLCLSRAFATDPQGSRSPHIPKPPDTLRLINLPKTWRGKLGAFEAKQYWMKTFEELTGKEPPENAPGRTSPLILLINDSPSFVKNELSQDGIMFTYYDELGQKLWRIANPLPWSQQPRWTRWTTYALVGLYAGLALYWITHRERVPITGRKRFQCVHFPSPPNKEVSKPLIFDETAKGILVSDDDPRVLRARSVLDRILSASGLDHLQWHLLLMDTPGKFLTWLNAIPAFTIPNCHH